MWVFLTGDVMTFVALLAGYAFFRFTLPDGPGASAVLDLPIGLCMTILLAISSTALFFGIRMLREKRRQHLSALMTVTLIAGISFIGLQAYEWRHLIDLGFGLSVNSFGGTQFSGLFFMITGFHGLHVLAGIIYLLIVLIRHMRSEDVATDRPHPVETAGVYWQFVDGVWLFIFIGLYII